MSVLVVVASYNGKDFLPRLLSSLEEHKKEEFDILVVDTGTTDIESLKVLESIKSKYMVEKTPYAGYELPKPLIDVNGKPMIQRVIENLNIEANYIFLVRKEHEEKYNVSSILKTFEPNCEIVFVESLTEGAACTTLLAKDLIDNSNPLFIANSDQLLEWNSCEFYHSVNSSIDGSILVFEGLEDKWSYVKTDLDGNVTEVAEKIIISNTPTCGLYYFNKGSDYVKYAEQMIDKNIRHGSSFNGMGEFYVAPVYNEYIKDSKIIKTFKVDKMIGLGTPEELQVHLNECQRIL